MLLLSVTALFGVGLVGLSQSDIQSAQLSRMKSQSEYALRASSYPFGVQILTAAGSADFGDLLAKAKGLGMQWVRVYVEWNQIQPNAPTTPGCGNCDWSYPDSLFAALATQNLTPIVTIEGNPNWAAPYTEGYYPNGPLKPSHLADFRNFVAALVQRYPNVQYWEFYNEPDDWTAVVQPQPPPYDHRGWGGHGDQYAAMLKIAYTAIHAAGSNGTQYVVFGGVAYEPNLACSDRPKGQCFDNNFVGDVLNNADGSPLFDVMNFHYYDAFASYHQPANIVGKALEIKNRNSFLNNKPFVVTEMGKAYQWGTDPNFSHEVAARQVVQMYTQLESGADPSYNVNILAGTWFTLEHFEEQTGGDPRLWGLLDKNRQPWPTETGAWTTAVKQLSTATYLSRVTDTVDAEGYNFVTPEGLIRTVLWATDGAPSKSFPTTSLSWLDNQGNVTTVTDNGPGDNDLRAGWIGLAITPSPIFVEYRFQILLSPILKTYPAFSSLLAKLFGIVCSIYHLPCVMN
jgi:hypothetical protein